MTAHTIPPRSKTRLTFYNIVNQAYRRGYGVDHRAAAAMVAEEMDGLRQSITTDGREEWEDDLDMFERAYHINKEDIYDYILHNDPEDDYNEFIDEENESDREAQSDRKGDEDTWRKGRQIILTL